MYVYIYIYIYIYDVSIRYIMSHVYIYIYIYIYMYVILCICKCMSMYVYVSTWCHLLKTSCLTKRWVLGVGASKYIYIYILYIYIYIPIIHQWIIRKYRRTSWFMAPGHLGLWPRNCWGSTVFPNRPIRGGLCHQIAWHNHCNHRNSNHSDHRNQSQQSHHHHHPFLTHYLPIATHQCILLQPEQTVKHQLPTTRGLT